MFEFKCSLTPKWAKSVYYTNQCLAQRCGKRATHREFDILDLTCINSPPLVLMERICDAADEHFVAISQYFFSHRVGEIDDNLKHQGGLTKVKSKILGA